MASGGHAGRSGARKHGPKRSAHSSKDGDQGPRREAHRLSSPRPDSLLRRVQAATPRRAYPAAPRACGLRPPPAPARPPRQWEPGRPTHSSISTCSASVSATCRPQWAERMSSFHGALGTPKGR